MMRKGNPYASLADSEDDLSRYQTESAAAKPKNRKSRAQKGVSAAATVAITSTEAPARLGRSTSEVHERSQAATSPMDRQEAHASATVHPAPTRGFATQPKEQHISDFVQLRRSHHHQGRIWN